MSLRTVQSILPTLAPDIERFAFVIDGAPEIHPLDTDEDDHHIQVLA